MTSLDLVGHPPSVKIIRIMQCFKPIFRKFAAMLEGKHREYNSLTTCLTCKFFLILIKSLIIIHVIHVSFRRKKLSLVLFK